MVGIGIGIITVGYWLGLWGYCLFTGYDVSLWDLISTANPTWPPAKLADSQIWPHTSTGLSTDTTNTSGAEPGSANANNTDTISNAVAQTAPALGGLGGGSLPAR